MQYSRAPEGAAAWEHGCSLRHPACVHAAPGTAVTVLAAALAAEDRAWDTLTGALALPAPDAQDDGRWHLYLVDGIAEGARAELVGLDPRSVDDRGVSLGLVDRATPPGCMLDRAVARALAGGALLRAAPATDPGSARAETQMLARLATPCAGADDDLFAFQATPERAVVDPEDPAASLGASMFFAWLESTFASRPGALVEGLWALAPTRSTPGELRWPATPTGFDVLRTSLKGALGTDSTLDDALLDFAIDRGLAWPPVRLAWHVPWPEHPRRFASPVPVAPTGASYVLVDRAGAPAGASLRVEATWEDYGRMRWAVVKVDAAGRPRAILPIGSTRLATHAALTVEIVDDADRILVVGANVGSTEAPFDPNQGGWEPHGWLLTIQAL